MSELKAKMILLQGVLNAVNSEVDAFESGTKAAAPRARKNLQLIRNQALQLRADISVEVKKRPPKPRNTKLTISTEKPPADVIPEPPPPSPVATASPKTSTVEPKKKLRLRKTKIAAK